MHSPDRFVAERPQTDASSVSAQPQASAEADAELRLEADDESELWTVLAPTALTLLLVAARVYRTHQVSFAFLGWNLFLAWLPYGLSRVLDAMERRGVSTWTLFWVGVPWLLVLPNAPYVVTDLVHLKERPPVPLWYDTAMLFCAGWTGCALGFQALRKVQGVVERRVSTRWSWAFALTTLGLCAIGMQFGRFERFNSWDVVSDPLALLEGALRPFLHPLSQPGAWEFTFVFAALLLTTYPAFARRREPHHPLNNRASRWR
jgi:uncharacterized membrane protein